MKKFIPILIFALTLSCGRKTEPGNQATEDRTVKPFTKVEVSGAGSLIITQGDEERLGVTAGEYVIGSVISEVKDGTLRLDARHQLGDISYAVQVKTLEAVTLSGDGRFDIPQPLKFDELSIEVNGIAHGELNLDGEQLSVEINGAVALELAGQVKGQEVVIYGAADYEAPDLKSEEVSVVINGAGNVTVAPSKSLDVTIRGGGVVQYVGSPTIEQKITGGGRVEPLSQRETHTQSNGPAPRDDEPARDRDGAENGEPQESAGS
jgi:Putative auto-transporter adhesin, head GIN domain